MKKYYIIILTLLSNIVFANYEVYDGQTISVQSFIDAKLNYSSWRSAKIYSSNFTGASLKEADFTGATLNGNNFQNANLKDAVFENTKNYGVNLSSANLTNVSFVGTTLIYGDYTSNFNFESANLTNANLSGLGLAGGYFKKAIFKNANLTNANSSNTSMTSGYENVAIFDGADLTRTNFSEANLASINEVPQSRVALAVSLQNTIINETYFTGARLAARESYYDAYVDFSNMTLIKANFTNAILSSKNWSGSDGSSVSFSNATLIDCVFTGAILGANGSTSGVDFSNMDMSNVSFAGATFNNYVKLNNCNIQGADFSSAINLNISNINSTQSYLDKNLSGVKFANLDLSNWAFREQNLQNASFANSTLTNANMRFSDLRGADLSEAIDINTIKLTNTIWHDGVIKMFSMESDEDSFSIKRYALSSENQLSISAKITEDDAIISGGAILTLETGAELEVIDDGILTIASDGNLVINTDEVGSTLFAIADGAGLTFESGAILRINIEGAFVETDGDVIVLMSWTDDSNISGVNIFTIDENLFLTVNGEAYSGDWNYRIADNQFQVFFGQIPEPAFYAAVFGVFALAFAAWRRKAK